jgi:SAM-dependent methyltransferase
MLIQPGATVLDVGAGSCPYRNLFGHAIYKTHDFIQLNPEQLRGKQGYGKVDYVGDICMIPTPDKSFEVLLCTEVLEHVPEPIRALNEFARILKPGGKLIITAPLGSSLHQEPFHFYGGYTPYWYKKFLVEAGFEQIVIEQNGGAYSLFGQECMRFVINLAPWSNWRNLFFIFIWLISLPICLLITLTGPIIDKLDHTRLATIGYHIVARRKLE